VFSPDEQAELARLLATLLRSLAESG